jgi:hypothetical protein
MTESHVRRGFGVGRWVEEESESLAVELVVRAEGDGCPVDRAGYRGHDVAVVD